MSVIKMYIGFKLKELRKANKLTQRELGKIVGLENNTISAIERGVNSLSSYALYKLACRFNVPVSYFFPTIKEMTSLRDHLVSITKQL